MHNRAWNGGTDVIKNEIDIEINRSHDSSQADIFNKLNIHKDKITIKPLTEGKLVTGENKK